MTALEKVLRAERFRIKKGSSLPASVAAKFAGSAADGWNGWFLLPLEGEMWLVCISDGLGWKHLSISNAQKKVLPSWTVMTRIKDAFFGDDEWVVQFFPAQEDYINDCEWCLHLWMPLNEPLPKPSFVLV